MLYYFQLNLTIAASLTHGLTGHLLLSRLDGHLSDGCGEHDLHVLVLEDYLRLLKQLALDFLNRGGMLCGRCVNAHVILQKVVRA